MEKADGDERKANGSGGRVGRAAAQKGATHRASFFGGQKDTFGVVADTRSRNTHPAPLGITPVLEMIECTKSKDKWNRRAEIALAFVVGCAVATAFFVIRTT
jgi:hypothetical protein